MMKNKPKVSVVITCYNYAGFVKQAIESVLDQTYNNIDLTIINDGSTDGSKKIIDKYKNRAKIISRDNRGIVYTRNEAISVAKGEYIIQLDADDTIPKDYVETLVKEAIATGADICYTPAVNLNTKQIIIEIATFNLEKLKIHNFIHSSSLVSSKKIKKYSYDENLKNYGYEDWDVFLAMCLDGAKAIPVSKTHLNYRIHNKLPSRSDKLNETVKKIDANRYIILKNIMKHPAEMDYMVVVAEWLYELREITVQKEELDEENSNLLTQLERIRGTRAFRFYSGLVKAKKRLLNAK